MNWITSIKDKSTKLVSNISSKVTQRGNGAEPLGAVKENEIQKKSLKPHVIELKESSNTRRELDHRERDYQALIEVLKPFASKKAIYVDKLEDIVELVLSNPNKYLRQDPVDFVIPAKENLSDFNVFYEKNKPDEALLTKILTFDPTLPQLFITDEHVGHERKDNILRFIMRFVYVVLYFLETGKVEKEKNKQSKQTELANKENEVEQDNEKGKAKNGKEEKDKLELTDRK